MLHGYSNPLIVHFWRLQQEPLLDFHRKTLVLKTQNKLAVKSSRVYLLRLVLNIIFQSNLIVFILGS